MRAKTAILILCMVLSAALVSASDYAPSWWNRGEEGDISKNFMSSLIPFYEFFNKDPMDSADDYNWYNGSSITLREWERSVCMEDLSSDVISTRDTVTMNGQDRIYTTTYTLSAIKHSYGLNSTYYEVSWYLMPYNTNLLYRLYLVKNNKKEFLVGKDGAEGDNANFVGVSALVGASGYDVRNIITEFSNLVLEYKLQNSSELLGSYSVKVVDSANIGGAAGQQSQRNTPGNNNSGNPSGGGNCPAPVPPKVTDIRVKAHNGGWDATPIITRNCAWCLSIGYECMPDTGPGTNNPCVQRCGPCPARQESDPDRPACERVMMGGNPRWFCNGREIQPSGDNPYFAKCEGSVKVCNADLSVCGQPD